MADYWKSQPRKFCQYCKCWIADNKPSIEFHERGKNHKENVAAKIEEIKKKSIDKAKKEERMSKEFAAMEEAALKAYQEDMKRLQAESGMSETPVKSQSKTRKPEVEVTTDTDSNDQSDAWVEGTTDDGQIYYYNVLTGESQWDKPEGFQGDTPVSAQSQTFSGSAWMEAVSPDGYTYYYNTETGESSWEKPADFDPQEEPGPPGEAEEQGDPSPPKPEALSGGEDSSDASKGAVETEEVKQPRVPKISFRKRKEEATQPSETDKEKKEGDEEGDENKEKEDDPVTAAPPEAAKEDEIPAKKPRKTNPYGEWEQIVQEEDPYENVDLQLPQVDNAATAAATTSDLPPEPKPKFKERTITSLGVEGSEGATFRKRKTENGKSRSIRQRGKDD